MKYLYTALFFILVHTVFLPDIVLCVNDNQLITEIKVVDNDSSFRYLYLYNNLGKKVVETKYFQQDSTWIRKSLNEWIYTGNDCTNYRERIWKDNSWLISYTIDYEFNNGHLDFETHTIYNNGVASLLKKIAFQYNKALLTSKKEYEWQSNAWILSIETDFHNLDNGKTDSLTTTNFQSGNINNQLLSTFIYNPDGTLQSQLLKERAGNDWLNSELINWFYTSNTSLIESVRNKKWKSDTSNWENTQRIDYLYNDSSELTSETCQRWSTMYWKNDIRYNYQYDYSNKLLKKTLLKPIYNDWRELISINYSDFTQTKANNIESRYEFWGGNTGQLTTSYIPFIFNDEMTVQKGKTINISYLPVETTGIFIPVENHAFKLIPVYPNPSDGIFYINTQQYNIKLWTVSNLNGQILKKQVQAFQSGVIDLTDFPKGIYILHVTTQDEQMIQKLIKQ